MSIHNYAEHSQFGDIIKRMHNGEVSGSNMYYVLAWIAREKGYDDLFDALMKNAAEDSLHGGMYGAMLGKAKAGEEDFWHMVVNFYRLESQAGPQLQEMADKVRAAGEEVLARCIESTIDEESEHARRLEDVFKSRGISWQQYPCRVTEPS